MKKIFYMVIMTIAASLMASAQTTVVWQDDFTSDKGWQIFEYKKQGAAEYTKDGKLMLKSEEDYYFISKCKTNLNANKNFLITVDAESKSGLKDDSYFGIVFNYLDGKNHMRLVVEKGYAYFVEIKNGEIVRQDWDVIKNTKAKIFNLQLKKTGNTVIFSVNDEEALEIEKIDVVTSKIGLCVIGKTQVAFDNMKILQ